MADSEVWLTAVCHKATPANPKNIIAHWEFRHSTGPDISLIVPDGAMFLLV